jgi:hypothetical protein
MIKTFCGMTAVIEKLDSGTKSWRGKSGMQPPWLADPTLSDDVSPNSITS